MNSQGDEILRDEIEQAITVNSKPSADGVCGSHDGIRTGILVLLKCKRAEMRSPAWQVGGIGIAVGTGVYAVLKSHGVVP